MSPTLRIIGRFNYAILGDDGEIYFLITILFVFELIGSIKRTEDADIVDAKIETRRAGDRLKEVFHG